MSPHFVVGMPRAGTTFLVRSLNQHSQVVAFGESRFWGNDWIEPGLEGYDQKQLDAVVARLSSNPLDTNIGADGPEPDRAGWLSSIGRPDLSGLAESAIGSLPVPADPGKVFATWCDAIAQKEGKSVAVEKTPHHLRHIDRILRYLPEARFAIIIRDPVEFLLSYKHFGDRKSAEKQLKADQRWDPIGVALIWRAYLRHANQAIQRWPERTMLIRNELLKAEPVRVTGEVATFFGLEAEGAAWREFDDLPTNTSFAGQRPTLSGAEVTLLRRIAGQDAAAAGYEISPEPATLTETVRVASSFVPWAVRNLAERSRNTDGSMVAYARKAILR